MNYAYQYRPLNQRGTGEDVGYFPGNIAVQRTPDFTNYEGSGIVEVLQLKPGNYEFYNISMINNNGMGTETYKFRKDFSMSFTIKSGQAVYVGHFLAKEIKAHNLFGVPVPAGAQFLVSDQASTDLRIAATPRDNLVLLLLNAIEN